MNDQNAFVMTIRGRDDEVVQIFKVSVVSRQDGPSIANGVGQVDLIAASRKADIGRDLNIVPVAPQQSDETRIDAVVVDAS